MITTDHAFEAVAILTTIDTLAAGMSATERTEFYRDWLFRVTSLVCDDDKGYIVSQLVREKVK